MKTKIIYTVKTGHINFIKKLLECNRKYTILNKDEVKLIEAVVDYQFYTHSEREILNKIRKNLLHIY